MLIPKRPCPVGGPHAWRGVLAWIACIGFALFAAGCPTTPPDGPSDNSDDANDPTKARTCEGCHTSETLVKALATDEVLDVESSGEG